MKKVVLARINKHLDKNDLNQPFKSAYRKFHPTETALFKVHSNLASALEKRKMYVLILLDLSAAFDIIDNSILLKRLADRFSIRGTALDWFRSYLTGRTQVVKAAGNYSTEATLHFGVPQGSILGPLLFSMYNAPVADIALRNGLCVHLYADNTQLYVTRDSTNDTVTKIEQCVAEIKDWMNANFLRLNADKTEVLLIGSPFQLNKLPRVEICMGDLVANFCQKVGCLF